MSATYPGESLATQEYHYPRRWVWGWRLLFGLPSAVVLLRFVLGWAEAIFTLLQEVGLFPASAIRADFVDLSRNTWALFFLLLLFYFFYNIFPKFRIGPTHLEVSFFGGWYPLAWSDVTRLVSTQMGETERLIVLVQVRQSALPLGRRLAYSLQGALYGVGFVPGFLVISDLIGFDELVATIASQLGGELASPEPITLAPGEEQAATPASGAVMDEYFSPLWQMLFQPGPTLQRLVEGLADLELRPAVRLDLLLAAAPALLFVMSSWLFGHNLWSVLFVLFLALLEGALGPLNVWALS
ncbi:MAG: hypothetical protein HYZ68_00810, partial [Chloroflexi bacterium]|nr:hypothetical protein [Chloroflexota bacterium]